MLIACRILRTAAILELVFRGMGAHGDVGADALGRCEGESFARADGEPVLSVIVGLAGLGVSYAGTDAACLMAFSR